MVNVIAHRKACKKYYEKHKNNQEFIQRRKKARDKWRKLNKEKAIIACKKWYQKNKEKAYLYQVKWVNENREHVRKRDNIYSKTEQHKQKRRKYYKRNKEKVRARGLARYALRKNKIKRKFNCEICNKKESPLHMHHEDYKKPLVVKFLCFACHLAIKL